MRRVDTNGDGCMDFDEFARYFRATAEAISVFRRKRAAAEKGAARDAQKQAQEEAEMMMGVSGAGTPALSGEEKQQVRPWQEEKDSGHEL